VTRASLARADLTAEPRPAASSLCRQVHAERLKLRSAALPGWGALAAVALAGGLGLIRAAVAERVVGPQAPGAAATAELLASAVTVALAPLELFVAALGAAALAEEHRNGSILATLTATPRRVRVFAAKTTVIAVFTLAVALLAGGAAALCGSLGLSVRGYAMDAAVLTACLPLVGGQALALTLLAMLALAAGTLTRSTAAGLLILVAVLFVLPAALGLMPQWTQPGAWVQAALPAGAVRALTGLHVEGDAVILGVRLGGLLVASWTGLLVLLGWTGLAWGCAALFFARRDLTRPGGMPGIRRVRRLRGDTAEGSAEPAALSTLGVLRAEWIKLRSLVRNQWLAVVVLLCLLGYGVVRAATVRPDAVSPELAESTRIETVYAITGGIGFAQLLVGAGAILAVTAEYGSGSIRPALIAVPRRVTLIVAKLFVTAGATAALALIGLGLTAVAIARVHEAAGYAPADADSVAPPILSGALYLVLVTILAQSIGGLLRSAAAAIAALCGLLAVLPALFNAVLSFTRGSTAVWIGNLGQFLPVVGDRFYQAVPEAPIPWVSADGAVQPSPLGGLLILCAWSAVAVAVWTIAFRRRDLG